MNTQLTFIFCACPFAETRAGEACAAPKAGDRRGRERSAGPRAAVRSHRAEGQAADPGHGHQAGGEGEDHPDRRAAAPEHTPHRTDPGGPRHRAQAQRTDPGAEGPVSLQEQQPAGGFYTQNKIIIM